MAALSPGFHHDDETPVYVISVAAQLAGMHAQTLRQYDRLGIVSPSRTRGGGRRYSARDVDELREVQRLSQEGISLAGIRRIMQLQEENARLRSELDDMTGRLDRVESLLHAGRRVFAADPTGDVVAVRAGRRPNRAFPASRALVLWNPLGGPRR